MVFDEIGWPGPMTVRQTGAVSAAAYRTWDEGLFRKYLTACRAIDRKDL